MAKFSPGELVTIISFASNKKRSRYFAVTTYKLPITSEEVWKFDDAVRPGVAGLIVTKVIDPNNVIYYDVLFSDRLRVSRVLEKFLKRLDDENTGTTDW